MGSPRVIAGPRKLLFLFCCHLSCRLICIKKIRSRNKTPPFNRLLPPAGEWQGWLLVAYIFSCTRNLDSNYFFCCLLQRCVCWSVCSTWASHNGNSNDGAWRWHPAAGAPHPIVPTVHIILFLVQSWRDDFLRRTFAPFVFDMTNSVVTFA